MKCKKIIEQGNKYNLCNNPTAKGIKEEVYNLTDTFPDKISYSKRLLAIYHQKDCICLNCGKIHGNYVKEYCSNKCYQKARKESAFTKEEYIIKQCISKGEKKFKDKKEDYDYQICKICGAKTGDLGTHIIMHRISSNEYKVKYNVTKLKPDRLCEIRQGKNNPAYRHGGRLSAWSKNFIHGYDAKRHDTFKENQRTFMQTYEDSPFKYVYWLKFSKGNEVEAKKLYKKYQTRNLDWFIEKYGLEEGPIRHKEKTEKWVKSFKKSSYSKISQELFDEISKYIDCTNIYYATFLRDDMISYKNKEYILELSETYIRPDFIDIGIKKIIEFDGDYWHSLAKANPEREQLRDVKIKQAGYEVLHIKEYDYKNNKQQVIDQCINFLKQ